LEIITNKSTSVAFFTLLFFAATWYHIKKVKHQVDASQNKRKSTQL